MKTPRILLRQTPRYKRLKTLCTEKIPHLILEDSLTYYDRLAASPRGKTIMENLIPLVKIKGSSMYYQHLLGSLTCPYSEEYCALDKHCFKAVSNGKAKEITRSYYGRILNTYKAVAVDLGLLPSQLQAAVTMYYNTKKGTEKNG